MALRKRSEAGRSENEAPKKKKDREQEIRDAQNEALDKARKKSAAERTRNMFEGGSETWSCGECKQEGTTLSLKVDSDGTSFCPECGNRLEGLKPSDPDAPAHVPKSETKEKKTETSDDVPKASSSKAPPSLPITPLTSAVSTMKVVETEKGQMLFYEWGQAMFRAAEFSTFHVGPFNTMLPLTVIDGDAVITRPLIEVYREAKDQMKEIADEEFEMKSTWYLEKLGLLKKKVTKT